jgi:lipopolysaccharide transport system permease protein
VSERRALLGAIWTLARTDFKVRYHGTAMGFVWAMLKPLSMFGVLLAVFHFLFSNPDYGLHLVTGLFLYEFFTGATTAGLVSLHTKGYLLTKSDFPRWILVGTSTTNSIVTLFAASLGIVLYLGLVGRFPSPLGISLYVFYMFQLALIAYGLALGGSVLFVRYRDLNQVWEVLAQAGFFVAPVIYPLAIIPERLHFYLYLWPPTAVIQFSREVLTTDKIPSLRGHLLLAGVTTITLLVGVLLYRRLEPRAAEYL